MKMGEYEIQAVESGFFGLDGGAMFGVVPKVLWEKTNPADASNRILMALRCLLIQGHDRTFLVDTGIGERWSDKQKSMYAIDHSQFTLESSLEKLGVHREDVTDVIFTHLHFDHVGGATRMGREGASELTFPNARHYIQEKNLAHAHAPSDKDRASFLEHTLSPVLKSDRLVTLTGPEELSPGVSIWVTEGHTPGQQLVKVKSGRETLLFCGDTIPTASHIPLPYIMGYDLFPMTTLEEKKVILESAVQEQWTLAFVHDPKIAACRVEKANGKFMRGNSVVL
jgi:glyoxylase-like metal-dependent hydrolase (beta-lactamase superfamily II)